MLGLGGNALTGPIPDELGALVNLQELSLQDNSLRGPVPAWLGNLTALRRVYLQDNALAGLLPRGLESLVNLETLRLSRNPGIRGPLPAGLRLPGLLLLAIDGTRACAPADWAAWLATIDFIGRVCGPDDVVNRPPAGLGGLPNLELGGVNRQLDLDVSRAFADPDGDPLTYAASSSAPQVVTAVASGARVTLTALAVGTATVDVRATDPGGRSAAQSFVVTVRNRPPEVVQGLPDLELVGLNSTLGVDVSRVFVDPDGDRLSYAATSSKPYVAAVRVSEARVTVTAVAAGSVVVAVRATDPAGLSASQSLRVRVRVPFTDHPIEPGVTPVRAVHFTELRERIDVLRRAAALGRFAWTDPVLRPGVTRVRRAHLLELRRALAAVYAATGRLAPGWTDAGPLSGETPIRAAHLMELRAAVTALE